MLAWPWRSIFTSVPASTMPASKVSWIRKLCRALRFCAAYLSVSRRATEYRSVDQAGAAHRLGDAFLALDRDLAERQPCLGGRLAEQRGSVLDRPRARLAEHRVVQRRQALIDPRHRLEIAALPRLVEVGAEPRRDIGGHRDAAMAALREIRHHGDVLARELAEIRADGEPGAQRPGEIHRRILDADDILQLGEPCHRRHRHVDNAAWRDVV